MLHKFLYVCLSAAMLAGSSPLPTTSTSSSDASSGLRPDVVTFRKEVVEVHLAFAVQDAHHRLVPNIAQNDIAVLEDGKPVAAFAGFSQNSNLPLQVALIVDRSDSMQKGFPQEQQAAQAFLSRLLRPAVDQVFLLDFANQVARSEPSGTPKLISARVEALAAGGQTALFDALYEASRQLETNASGPQPSRRVFILLSDGEDNFSRHGLPEVVEAAQRAEISIYAITAHRGRDQFEGDSVLHTLADATGGRTFVLKNYDAVDRVFSQIEDELRTQYSVTFRQTNSSRCGYHALQVLHQDPKLQVRARRGYYACPPTS